MYDRIVERLTALGYVYDNGSDDTLLESEMKRGEAYVLSFCNLTSIPEEIEEVYIDIVCGYFLRSRLYNGDLSEGGAVSGIAEKITEGDVSVEYAADKEVGLYERADRLISGLLNKETELTAVKKLKW